MKILIAVGGTGGHLLPAQQLADELSSHAEILFAGGGLGESRFFDREKFAFCSIAAAPWASKKRGAFIVSAFRGTWQAMRLLFSWKPDLVIGFGSFHAFPVLLAALLFRKKIALFEANCLLGKVNRLFAPFASLIASQFPLEPSSSKVRLVPLLPWKKQKHLALTKEKKSTVTILVFGGSQGAQFLNQIIPAVIPVSAHVIHIAGNEEAVQVVRELYRERGIQASVMAFEKEMPKAYAAADVAICRAGASTLAELIRYEVPALFIPYPFAADDHQRINAEFLAKKVGGAKMIKQESATPARLSQEVNELLGNVELFRAKLAEFRKSCEGRISFKEEILKL
jgi:UDP-N-acetylglucosamine--N-acetylmuramyl-(pentapeptide) pyrophosphoryl-undecaprenol N-acetylglucosamine transferase